MKEKKEIRRVFRDAVFSRDGHRCRVCSTPGSDEAPLDAHHIMDRHDMPHGGYVKENGISLCPDCHIKAEGFHTGKTVPGYEPETLYALIGSSLEAAIAASEARLGDGP